MDELNHDSGPVDAVEAEEPLRPGQLLVPKETAQYLADIIVATFCYWEIRSIEAGKSVTRINLWHS